MKQRMSYTYESKCGLNLQILKISIELGNLWDHLRQKFRVTHVLKLDYRLGIVCFDMFQDCGR